MPSPLKTLTPLVTTAAIALSLGLLANVGTASAAPMQAGSGLTSPGLQVEDVGYKRYRKYQQFYAAEDQVPAYNYNYGYPGYRPWMPYHGSIEIQELQRAFPETNWPPSMRY